LEQRINDAVARLEEIQEEVTNRIIDGIDNITSEISESLNDFADRISRDDEPVVLVNTSRPTVETSNDDYYAYAAIASVGVVAAAAFALYGKKSEKQIENEEEFFRVDEEFERI